MNQLIVITAEEYFNNEPEQINKLFKSGLELLHVRKPNSSFENNEMLLQKIDKQFHQKIVLHQHYELTERFRLKGIHLKEKNRIDLGNVICEFISTYHKKNLTVSTGFHSKEELTNNVENFDYVFISPIFNSISKKNYEGKYYEITDINKTIVALGGINRETMPIAFELGYKNMAVLGAVWNNPCAIKSFKILFKIFHE